MIRRAGILLGSGLVAVAQPAAAQHVQRFEIPALPGGGFQVPMRSMLDARFYTVIRQRYDFSCGSAALATLLHYHYGVAASEDSVFAGMWKEGDRTLIKQQGFSLLDMKRYLTAIGLSADGYRVTLDDIAKAGVPGIALTVVDGYRHFIVIKGVRGDHVLVGDPSKGLLVYDRAAFGKIWDGLFFVVTAAQDVGKSSFNRSSQWAHWLRAPVSGDFARPLSEAALSLAAPQLGDF
ncbi:C39 family peptidase [Hephaestia mangrovi]|uniref:C39 family peptidase n=1 Tax=Hephaestia mangrovi TaxID=2873268 RepID=UPI001CA65917|nr:C39 family peptidase [Hephaestia mangrovi]MBY8828356.1 C39 family peptidase [Hephaestia mangrovi]